MVAIGEEMKTHVVDLLDALAPPPCTVLHGDWRLDNIFFGPGNVAAIDWQISTKGRGAFDVAYFLSSCLDPGIRRINEMPLLRMWHEIASDGGSGGYSFDDALTDYRRAVLFCNVYTVIAIGSLDPANERGVALLKAWLTRRSAAIEDLDAGELMPE
jgi:aminoglycoside phosphotransferase (APT) family kinase protein